jgi:hypothetical protein
MRIDTEAFLAITALLAATVAPASSSDSNGGTTPDGGTGGSGATSSGGKGGKAGSATGGGGGSGGAGARAGAGGTSGGAGGGASGSGGMARGGADSGADSGGVVPEGGNETCLGDTAPPLPDAGAGVDICDTLPAALDGCHPDSGVEGLAPAYSVCSDFEYSARPGVFADVVKCLTAASAPADPCGTAAFNYAVGCYDSAVARACPRPSTDGGLVNPCGAFVAACTTVTAAECNGAFRSFSEEGAGEFSYCIDLATPAGGDAGVEGDCRTAFWACALPGVAR